MRPPKAGLKIAGSKLISSICNCQSGIRLSIQEAGISNAPSTPVGGAFIFDYPSIAIAMKTGIHGSEQDVAACAGSLSRSDVSGFHATIIGMIPGLMSLHARG